ncbi:MAG TPA: protein kinase, partial [Acetobacteraceae bacterium]|nr:protein kinase [Acetobacteraceae bacterium]
KYELRKIVGRGAIGVVYEAWDLVLKRKVAVKTLPLIGLDTELGQEKYQRFQREAQAAARLYHPNIAITFDYGETNDLAYIVMEYLDGPSVKELIDQGRIRPDQIKGIMQGLLAGLQHSHAQGIVHRDVKPANMLLSKEGEVKITDFGIAHLDDSDLTQIGSQVGTPAYMPPEQVLGNKVDARSDLYSSGVVLYEMLTGRRPFQGSTASVMHKILYVPAPRLSESTAAFPPALDALVAKVLAKDPQDRFASANEFWLALSEHLYALDAPEAAAAADSTLVLSPGRPAESRADTPSYPAQVATDSTLMPDRAQPSHIATTTTPSPAAPLRLVGGPRMLVPVAGVACLVLAGLAWFSVHELAGDRRAVRPPDQVATAIATPHPQAQQQIAAPAPAAIPAPAPAAGKPSAGAGATPQPPVAHQAPAVEAPPVTPSGPGPELLAGLQAIASKLPCSFVRADATSGQTVAFIGLSALGEASELEVRSMVRRSVAQLPSAPAVAWKVRRIDGPYCAVLDLLDPLTSGITGAMSFGFAVPSANDATASHDPAPPMRIMMPDFAASLLVDFYTADGVVRHLYPAGAGSARTLPARSEVNVGRPGTGSGSSNADFRTGLVTAVASSVSLFGKPRPFEESASGYLKDLTAASAQARQTGAHLTADATVVGGTAAK